MPDSDEFVLPLPGISARRWHTLLLAMLVIAVVFAIPAGIDVVAPFVPGSSAEFLLPVIFILALCYPVVFMVKARAKNEVAAGYTTVDFTDVAVAQVDPKSGRIVRHAGEPRPTRRFGGQVR